MTRHALLSLGLAATLMACGSDAGDEAAGADSAAMAADTMPRIPRVTAIDVGLAADTAGHIIGGVLERFPQPDTIFVAVRTQHAAAGAPVTVRLLRGETTVESVDASAGAPDADDVGRVVVLLPSAATAAAGAYRIEVLLDGASQGIREITIGS